MGQDQWEETGKPRGGGGTREGPGVRVDPISDYTFDQLHGIAKSQKHFAVLLVQTFLQGNSLMAAVFMGEGMGNLDWAKFYWKWLRAFIWVLSNGLGEKATGVTELCNSH